MLPDGLAQALGRLVRAAQAERVPGIAASLVRSGEIVWSDAAGVADAGGERMTPDHQHRIGSITKTVTAAAVMQLRDAGKLELDDPLGAHLPEATNAEPTIGRLLSHLAGIQREVPGIAWETLEFPTGAELVAKLADAEQVLSPGRAWHYSNLAFSLLGEVIERVGGMRYEDFVRNRILAPLGMSRTGFAPDPPVATAYAVEPYSDVVRPEPTLAEEGSLGAAGSLWSTPGDLCRWAAFLADPDPADLVPATVEEMAEVQTMVDRRRWTLAWGLGLELRREGDLVLVGHEGAMPGFLAAVFVSPEHRLGAAAVANAGNRGDPGTLAARLIVKALELDPPSVDEWAPGGDIPGEVAPLLGRWWTEGFEFVLSFHAGRLEARMVGDPSDKPPAVFDREAPDRFRAVSGREQGELLEVIRDEGGEPVKLYWATYPCTRAFRAFG
jgi:CubicO group peptidase (beta-lactamase class C family)